MTISSRLETALKLLLYLSGSFGYSLKEIKERFSISERTAYRYLQTLKNVGFVLDHKDGYYKVNKNEGEGKSLGDLLHFSREEAWILNKAIHSIDDSTGIKNELIKKLYSLYDFDRVIYPVLLNKENGENIHIIVEAIKNKNQILLKNYSSAKSGAISNRLVEPVSFSYNFNFIWCFEPESMENKLFKTYRIEKVEMQPKKWQYERRHREGKVDVFRMSSFKSLPVKLRLSNRARNLLCEEYPMAEDYILKVAENEFIFETQVCEYEGVGRFVMGLFDEIIVLESREFRSYLRGQKEKMRF